MTIQTKTYECPFCGDLFRAAMILGNPEAEPPCLDCVKDGFQPLTPEDKFDLLVNGDPDDE